VQREAVGIEPLEQGDEGVTECLRVGDPFLRLAARGDECGQRRDESVGHGVADPDVDVGRAVAAAS
jgi:hypothetical protein